MSKKLAKKATKTQSASIRIIGGSWRSRKLPVIDTQGLRPTTDKMRETLFNWLAPYVHGANILDTFAGTGALGLEALSRGAKHAHFVELNGLAAKQLNQNISALKCQNANVHHLSAPEYLSQEPKLFDIVFVDPPFDQDLWPQTLDQLSSGWLADDAILYIETPIDYTLSLPQGNGHSMTKWQMLKEKKIGQVRARLIQVSTKTQ